MGVVPEFSWQLHLKVSCRCTFMTQENSMQFVLYEIAVIFRSNILSLIVLFSIWTILLKLVSWNSNPKFNAHQNKTSSRAGLYLRNLIFSAQPLYMSVRLPIFSDQNSSNGRLHCYFSLILILIWRSVMKHMLPS